MTVFCFVLFCFNSFSSLFFIYFIMMIIFILGIFVAACGRSLVLAHWDCSLVAVCSLFAVASHVAKHGL